MYALQNDTNPGVRLKSLDALGNYVKNDTNVRDAVLRALVNDSNSGSAYRSTAADRAGQGRWQRARRADGAGPKDQSTYIKSQARTMLAQLPEID